MEGKFLSLRINKEMDRELSEIFEMMDKGLGVHSSKCWKVKFLINLGIEQLRKDGLTLG